MGEALFTTEMLRQMLLTSVVVWGIIQAIKPIIKKPVPEAWQRFIVRISSVLLGFGFGYLIGGDIVNAVAGGAGGALSSLLVTVFKAILRKRLGVSEGGDQKEE